MRKLLFTFVLSSFLWVLACGGDAPIVPPPAPKPNAWVHLGLENKTINRLVLTGGRLYACLAQGGVYRYDNPATSTGQWRSLGLDDLDVVKPGLFGVTDLVAVGDSIVVGVWSGTDTPGIFRSNDAGNTWVPSDTGFIKDMIFPSSGVVLNLKQSKGNPRFLVAGCLGSRVVYLSPNLGKSWLLSLGFDTQGEYSFHTVGLNPNDRNEIWAGGNVPNSGLPVLYRSVDGGNVWESSLRRSQNPFQFPDDVNSIAFDAQDGNIIYVSLDKTLIKSSDGGQVWFTSLDTLKKGVLWDVVTNPDYSKELFVCSTDSIYYSSDGGENWISLIPAPENVPPMKNLAIDWANRILYVSTYNPSRGAYQLAF